jgi:hypothetical protein
MSYPPSHPPQGPQQQPLGQPRNSGQTKVLFIGGAVAIVLLLVVVGVMVVANKSGDSSSSGQPQISGSRDDWLQAVCQNGTFQTPTSVLPVFRNATATGVCLSSAVSGATLFAGQWDSDYMMRNDFTGARLHYYSAGTNGSGVIGFAPLQGGERALQPLTKFGFTVNKLAS